MCGEHEHDLSVKRVNEGSSPRVRGTPAVARRARSGTGIIPACAGNTTLDGFWAGLDGDHPRVCGEHSRPTAFPGLVPGSSPRVRGTPFPWFTLRACVGIIPACAGNTVR